MRRLLAISSPLALVVGAWLLAAHLRTQPNLVAIELGRVDGALEIRMAGLPAGAVLTFPAEVSARISVLGTGAQKKYRSLVWGGCEQDTLVLRLQADSFAETHFGLHRTPHGLVCRPSLILPSIDAEICAVDVFSAVTLPGNAARRVRWPNSSALIYTGEASRIVQGGSLTMICAKCRAPFSDFKLAWEYIDKIQSHLSVAFGESKTQLVLVAIDERDFAGPEKREILSEYRSNLLTYPAALAADSWCRRVAYLAAECNRGEPRSIVERARLIAISDLLCSADPDHMPSCYQDPICQDIAIELITELGLEQALNPVDATIPFSRIESASIFVSGCLAARELAEVGSSGATPNALRAAWTHLAGIEGFGRKDVMDWLRPRIDASSLVRADDAPLPGKAEVELQICGNVDGIIEECGCIPGKAFGGLLRLADQLRRDRDSDQVQVLRICLGGLFPLPSSPTASPDSEAIVGEFLEGVKFAAFVPGSAEVVGLLRGNPVVLASWVRQPILACNLRTPPRGCTPLDHLDWTSTTGARFRFVAAISLDPARITGQDRQRAKSMLGLEAAPRAIVRAIRSAPADRQVVVLGMIHPADLAEIGSEREVLIVSGRGDVPRFKAEKVAFGQWSGSVGATRVHFVAPSYATLSTALVSAHGHIVGSTCETLDAPIDPSSQLSKTSAARLAQNDSSDARRSDARTHLRLPGSYVGSHVCVECHQTETRNWQATAHAHALDALRKVQRHRVPGCVSCHVVGFGETTGYRQDSGGGVLEHVGCEVCHGPGSAHVLDPAIRGAILLTPPVALCAECHTRDHSTMLNGRETEFMHRTSCRTPKGN